LATTRLNRPIYHWAFTNYVPNNNGDKAEPCRTPEHKQKYPLKLEMWANAQRDGRPADYRWRPLFNAAKIG